MTDRTEANERNLTGVWHGLYTYPTGLSVSFVATLIDSGSHLSGSTHEPSAGHSPGATLYATLSGSCRDKVVLFEKTYDRAGPDYENAIAYDGTLSGDGTEIEGRWTIRDVLSGKFLMIRSGNKAVAAKRKAVQRV